MQERRNKILEMARQEKQKHFEVFQSFSARRKSEKEALLRGKEQIEREYGR